MEISKIGRVLAVEIMGTMKLIILTKIISKTIILTPTILTKIISTTMNKINFRSGGFLAVPDVPGAADVIAAQEAIIRSRMITMIAYTIAYMITYTITYMIMYNRNLQVPPGSWSPSSPRS